MIKHIVMWKFKDGEEENTKKFLEGLNSLKNIIPEIKYMETGININPKNDYDAILISEFETMEDLEKYKNNPEHVKVSALCKQIRIDRKLLIDKPRKRPTYQMVGGKVEEGESPLEAAIRECHEELGNKAVFDEKLFELIMEFDEIATSDGKTPIHFYVFKYNGELDGEFTTSEEIERFKWYSSNDGTDILSNTLKNEVIPYCMKNNLID